MGTGIGAGIVSGGRLVRRHHDGAHLVPSTGAYGAPQTLASGPALVQRAHAMLQRDRRPSLLRDRDEMRAPDIFAASPAGAWAGRALGDGLVDYVALLGINLSAILNSALLVLGGSVGLALDGHLLAVAARLARHVPDPPIVKTSSLGVQATLLGTIATGLDLIHQGHGSAVAFQITAPGQGHAEATG